MPINFSRIPLLAALLGIASCTQTPARPAPADTFDTILEDIVQRYHLPGIALGVIEDGKVIYTRTIGDTAVGSGQPINADSLFKIASNSKAMTTGVLARLVDAGKLQWHDPVTEYLPQFRMHDPWVTQNMQVRDLLIHNSGLREGAGDLMLWPEPNLFTRADIIAGLAYLKPQHSFRSRYDYDNLMYVVAGEVAAAAGGAAYEDLVRRELFEPLGMTRCQAGKFNRKAIGNVAQPHMRQYNGNVVIREDSADVPVSTSAAAGGIRCSLNDMLTWMRMWLDPDMKSPQGTSWLSKDQRKALWSAHTPMPISKRQREWDGSRFNAYGYGWRLSDVDGVLRVAHTGTLAGMFSAVNLFPEKNAGFVFMINGDGSDARAVLNSALAKYFTAPDKARPAAWYAQSLESERAQEPATSKAPDTSSRLPMSARNMQQWLGVYRDPWFGEVSICALGGDVGFASAKSPQMTGRVMRVGDRLLVDWNEASIDAEPWLEFSSGQPAALQLTKVDPDADFSYDYEDLAFTRLRDCP